MAKGSDKAGTPGTPGKSAQIRMAVKATRDADPKFLPLVLGIPIAVFAVLLGLGFVLGSPILFGIIGFLLALIVAVVVFGRRATAAQFTAIEGQPGAAAAVLMSLRGDWRVTPAVAMTRGQDLVHRVVGRPGVVLVAEGAGSRPRELLNNELKRVRRVSGEAPLHEVIVGEGTGQVSIRKLSAHMMRLPRVLKQADVNALDARLKAIQSGPTMPLPKGPMPRGKMPRGKVR
jgi:hypothetical protein